MATVTHRALLTNTASTTTGTSAAFTPAVGDLLVVFVTVSGTLVAGDLTGTGAGLTFTRVTKTTSRTSGDSVYCFVSDQFVSAATSQTVTFTPNAAATGMIIHVASVASMSRSGRDAIRQYATTASNATGTPTLTFPAVTLTGNVVLGAIGSASASGTPPTSFTEGADSTYATPTTGMEYAYRNSGHTSATVTWTSSFTTWGGIAIELDTTSAGSLPAKAATLQDEFATQDAAKWTYAGTASASGGVGILPVQAGYTASTITAVNRYDLIASEFVFKVPQINTNANSDGPFMTIELHGGTYGDGGRDRLTWFIYANTIAAAYKNGPTETTLYSGGVPGTIGPWYRIRESGGTVYWDSSTDGSTWTNRASVALTSIAFSLKSLRIDFRAQAADANGTPYHIDSVNPSTGSVKDLASTVTATASQTSALSRSRDLASTSSAVASQTSAINRAKDLASTVSAVASMTAAVGKLANLASTSSAVASDSGAVAAARELAATSSAVASQTSAISRARLISALTDDFADLSQWTAAGGVTATGGVASFLPTIPVGDYDPPATLTSIDSYDLTGGELVWQMPTAPPLAVDQHWMRMGVIVDASNGVDFFVAASSSARTVESRSVVANVGTNEANVAYNAVNHQWFKLTESGGDVHWWTSADGSTWTEQGDGWTSSLDLSNVQVYFEYSGERTPASAATIDKVNLGGSVQNLASTVTATASQTSALNKVGVLASTSSAVASMSAAIARQKILASASSGVASDSGALATVRNLAASASAVASTSANLARTRALASTVTATASTTAALTETSTLAATASAVASMSAALSAARSLEATTSAVASDSGTLARQKVLAATASAVSSATGYLDSQGTLSASSSAVASTSAALARNRGLASTSSAVASTSAALDKTGVLAATTSATASTSGALSGSLALSATSSAVASAVGILSKLGSGLDSLVFAVASTSASLSATRKLAGSASASASATGALARTKQLAGSASAVASKTSAVKRIRALSGSSAAVSAAGGTVKMTRRLAAAPQAVASASGTILLGHKSNLASTVIATASASATVARTRPLTSSTSAVASDTAALVATRQMAGSSTAVASATSAVSLASAFSGAATASASSDAHLIRERGLVAQVTAVASAQAMIIALRTLFGNSTASASAEGLLVGDDDLVGTSSAVASVLASLLRIEVREGEPDGTLPLPETVGAVMDDFNVTPTLRLPVVTGVSTTLGAHGITLALAETEGRL